MYLPSVHKPFITILLTTLAIAIFLTLFSGIANAQGTVTGSARFHGNAMGDKQVSHSMAARNVKIRHDESTGMGFIAPPKQAGPDASAPPRQGKRQPIRVEEKIGRNTPCPCGSGKKYKKCHGAFS